MGYGYIVRMDEHHMTRRVWEAEVSGVRVRRTSRMGWTEGVERAQGMRGLSTPG